MLTGKSNYGAHGFTLGSSNEKETCSTQYFKKHEASKDLQVNPEPSAIMEHIIMSMHLEALIFGPPEVSLAYILNAGSLANHPGVLCSWPCRRHYRPPTVQWRAASDMCKLPIPRIKEKHAYKQAWLVARSS